MRKKRNTKLFLALAAALILAAPAPALADGKPVVESIRRMPIQHNGRVKSFGTFARQFLLVVYGKSSFERENPVKTVMRAAFRENTATTLPWIHVTQNALKAELGLPLEKQYFTYEELLPLTEKIEALVRGSRAERDKDQRPSRAQQAAETLYTQIHAVRSLAAGESLRLVPPASGEDWLIPQESSGAEAEDLRVIAALAAKNQWSEANRFAGEWNEGIHHKTHGKYKQKIEMEILYQDKDPFLICCVFYFLAFLFFRGRWKRSVLAAEILLIAGFAFHTLGLGLRIFILERPPVSNMYESMIYMNWALMIFAYLFWVGRRKNHAILAVGAALSTAVMIYGHLLPLDTNMEVLVPVLRSNYWLTIHVLTIVSSYGAFGLAMGLGHRHLALDAMGKLTGRAATASADTIHGVIQLGVLLIGIGTVLGGVWANESWGRFWGWDPKETWALITFLGYLIVVHLKYARRIDDFWTAVSSVLGFFLVLMTWYGVNFVLGRGLHSYGFGSGGMRWIVFFLAFEAAFLALILFRKFAKAA